MPTLKPVDFDPFADEQQPVAGTLRPVDHDPFAETAPEATPSFRGAGASGTWGRQGTLGTPADKARLFEKATSPFPSVPEHVKSLYDVSPIPDAAAIAKSAAKGVTRDLPRMAAEVGVLTGIAPETSREVIERANRADEAEKGEYSGVRKVLSEGARMLGPSLLPAIGSHAAVSKLLRASKLLKAAEAARLAGKAEDATRLFTKAQRAAKAAQALSSVAPAAFYGAARAGQTTRTAEERGVEPGIAPAVTGTIEGLGEYFGTKYLGKLFGIGSDRVVPTLKQMLKTLMVEEGTEITQEGGEALTEKLAGIRPEASPLREAAGVIGPTAVLTGLTGLGASALSPSRDTGAQTVSIDAAGIAARLTGVARTLYRTRFAEKIKKGMPQAEAESAALREVGDTIAGKEAIEDALAGISKESEKAAAPEAAPRAEPSAAPRSPVQAVEVPKAPMAPSAPASVVEPVAPPLVKPEPAPKTAADRRHDEVRREQVEKLMAEGNVEEVQNLIYKDSATGLWNRRAWDEAGKENLDIAVLDMEGLKYVNDTYGHEAGNQLIATTANVLREEGINAYRYGGDEFTVAIRPGEDTAARFEEVKARLRETPIDIETPNGIITIKGANFDYGLGKTATGKSYDTVFAEADTRVRDIKENRRSARRGNKPGGLSEVPAAGLKDNQGRPPAPAANAPKELSPPKQPPLKAKTPLAEKLRAAKRPRYIKPDGTVNWGKWLNSQGAIIRPGDYYFGELMDAKQNNPDLRWARIGKKGKKAPTRGRFGRSSGGFDLLAREAFYDGLIAEPEPEALFDAINKKQHFAPATAGDPDTNPMLAKQIAAYEEREKAQEARPEGVRTGKKAEVPAWAIPEGSAVFIDGERFDAHRAPDGEGLLLEDGITKRLGPEEDVLIDAVEGKPIIEAKSATSGEGTPGTLFDQISELKTNGEPVQAPRKPTQPPLVPLTGEELSHPIPAAEAPMTELERAVEEGKARETAREEAKKQWALPSLNEEGAVDFDKMIPELPKVYETFGKKSGDMNRIQSEIDLPLRLAEQYPSGKPVYEVQQKRTEARSALLHELIQKEGDPDGVLNDYLTLSRREEKQLFEKVLIPAGRENVYHVDPARLKAYAKEKGINLTEKQVGAYYAWKSAFDRGRDTLLDAYERLTYRPYAGEKWVSTLKDAVEDSIKGPNPLFEEAGINKEILARVEPAEVERFVRAFKATAPSMNLLKKYRSSIGDVEFYVPRVRAGGEFVVRVYEGDRLVDSSRAQTRLGAGLLKARKRKQYAGGQFRIEEAIDPSMPEELYQQVDPESLTRFVESALDKAKAEKIGDTEKAEFSQMLYETMAEQLKARGFTHAMKRMKGTPVEGYKTTGGKQIMFNYMSGLAGLITKMEAAYDFREAVKAIPLDQPRAREYWHTYTKDMLRNESRAEAVGAKARAAAYLWNLGGNVKFIAVNLSQMPVVAWPVLARSEGRIRGARYIIKALEDVIRGKLAPNEQTALHEALVKGVLADQFTNEVMGRIGGHGGKALQGLNEVLSIPMRESEILNRKVAFLAKYRAEIKRGASNETAFAAAHDFTSRVNYTYGKGNLPPALREGTNTGAFWRTTYTFRSWQHNYASLIADSLRKGPDGKRRYDVLANSLAMIAAIGGLSSIPFLDDLLDIMERQTANPLRKRMRKFLRREGGEMLEKFGMRGLPALVGVDLSGSLKTGIPFYGDFEDSVFGVYAGMANKAARGFEAASYGDTGRALETISPTFAESIFKAKRQYEGPVRNLKGRVMEDAQGHPIPSLTGAEAVKQGMGFRPVRLSMISEEKRVSQNVTTALAEERTEIYARMRHAKTSKERNKVIQQAKRYNRKARASGEKVHIITIDDLREKAAEGRRN